MKGILLLNLFADLLPNLSGSANACIKFMESDRALLYVMRSCNFRASFMKISELPGTRSVYRLTNRALAQIKELWQYACEDELPPDSLLQAQVEALRILHVEVPLSAKRQFRLFCSEHFPGLADIIDCLAADELWALLSMRVQFVDSNQTSCPKRRSPLWWPWSPLCPRRIR